MDHLEKQYIIGMAGHIDHGKTALIRSLTGINTDRLKEEQERGITVDLGFAHFSENVTIIDVPGHERLIKNMIAGVSTIDLVLFVVAADDGIMPQTREHFDIINLLGVTGGIFVISKTDLVEEDWSLLVEEELRDFLQNTPFSHSPILKVSSVKGEGITELKDEISRHLSRVQAKKDDGIFRLPVDRVFTKPGFGTIVTGSVLSGEVKTGDEIELLPDKLRVRIRGLHSHDKSTEKVMKGYRAAINLAGISLNQFHRGQMLAAPDYFQPVESFNAKLSILKSSPRSIKNQMRLRIHVHTAETYARVVIPGEKEIKPGDSEYVQFRLEQPIFIAYNDRYVIRQYSPQITLGGGICLQVNPVKYRKKYSDEFLKTVRALESGTAEERIVALFSAVELAPLNLRQILAGAGLTTEEGSKIISSLVNSGELFLTYSGKDEIYYGKNQILAVLQMIEKELNRFHEKFPTRQGIPRKEIHSRFSGRYSVDLLELALGLGLKNGRIKQAGDLIAQTGFEIKLKDEDQIKISELEKLFLDRKFTPPAKAELPPALGVNEKRANEYLKILLDEKKLIFAEQDIIFHSQAVEEAQSLLRNFFKKNEKLTVSEFRELLHTTRKYALPLLSWFDNQSITRREADYRIAGSKL